MKNLQNKTAFITGGSRGIGAAIARQLAQQGANVVITYNNSADKAGQLVNDIKQQGGNALAIKADSANPQEITDAVNLAAKTFNGLHILVNNAGIGLYNHIDNLTLEDFDRISAINIRAVFAACKAALSYLEKGGKIITIGSCQASRVLMQGATLYAMSKSALIGLTKGLARDLGPKGIAVNLVNPGPIDTDMNPADGPFSDYQKSITAISAFGQPKDIANLVAFLAGQENNYLTGAELTIDGGTNI